MTDRIVILGSSGIISKNLQLELKEKELRVIVLGKKKINLKNKNSYMFLRKKIKNNDTVIFISAEAPVKNFEMFYNNISICSNVCRALKGKRIKKLIYISSDAVYSDSRSKLKESSETKPLSLHGLMHLSRELQLKTFFEEILCILRPTLIYGYGDTHQGYGPNKFLNLAKKNENITLFGNGEELRDHIYISDIIGVLLECIKKKKIGIFNLASGEVNSFYNLAKIIVESTDSNSKVYKTKRVGLMPHNGYRPFNIQKLKKNFKSIKFKSFKKGILEYLSRSN